MQQINLLFKKFFSLVDINKTLMEYIREVVLLGEQTMMFTDKDVKSVQMIGAFSISNSNTIFY